jgi:hypothetical protein
MRISKKLLSVLLIVLCSSVVLQETFAQIAPISDHFVLPLSDVGDTTLSFCSSFETENLSGYINVIVVGNWEQCE